MGQWAASVQPKADESPAVAAKLDEVLRRLDSLEERLAGRDA